MFFAELTFAVCLGVTPSAAPADGVNPPLLIGLIESAAAEGDALARGAEAALRQVNSTGGVDGRSLKLVRLAAPEPWRDGAMRIAELVFANDLAAIIGPTDGATAHVAAQIATRKRIPLIVLSPEGALTRVKDPWIFRGVPDDSQQARELLLWAADEQPLQSALIAVPGGRAGRERLAALAPLCEELGVHVAAVIEPGSTDLRALPRADLLLLWLEPTAALDLLQELERLGRTPRRVLGSTRLDVAGLPGAVPQGIETFALPRLLGGAGVSGDADLRSRLTHDMVSALVAAARRHGTAPAALRDGLLEIEALAGRSGEFGFDAAGNRVGGIPIAIIKDGKLLPCPAKPGSEARLQRAVAAKRG